MPNAAMPNCKISIETPCLFRIPFASGASTQMAAVTTSGFSIGYPLLPLQRPGVVQVDNLFVPNHWQAFCSEFGRNVNCVGVLMPTELDRDLRQQEDRRYMIHKCRVPASRIFLDPHIAGTDLATKRLQGWSQLELVNFMVALYHDMEAGGMWGAMLLHGVQPADIAAERVRSHEGWQSRGD